MSIRPVKKLSAAKPTLEGAGVHLRRAFGFGSQPQDRVRRYVSARTSPLLPDPEAGADAVFRRLRLSRADPGRSYPQRSEVPYGLFQ